jgi:hypothetical protein
MRRLLSDAYAALPVSPHVQVLTVPGIGTATAAAIVGKAVDINRFSTPERFVGYFGAFPEENSSGVDKHGNPLPPGTLRMSRKGNDLVRSYLWNAARSAVQCNPAIGALYRRLRAKGKRGDVALGHCMRKLLHLVYAVWKTNRPFDEKHFAWAPSNTAASGAPTEAPAYSNDQTPSSLLNGDAPAASDDTRECHAANNFPSFGNETAVGHKRDLPAKEVVTTANATVAPPTPAGKPAPPANRPARPKVDFAFLRQQISMEQVLQHLGLLDKLRGRALQRRGPCPIHGQPSDTQPTFSAHLGKNIFQCFHASCRAQGNVLDLWAAMHHLPLYEAALHLAETFHLPRNETEKRNP